MTPRRSKKRDLSAILRGIYSWQGVRAWVDSLFSDHAIIRMFWSNFSVVIPGRVYRCNHPLPDRLRWMANYYHINSVVNLRGRRVCGSDILSRRAAMELGLDHWDLPFESRGAPQKDRVLQFADSYKKMRFPIVLHCKSGADRAGLASALVLLIEGYDVSLAKRQLSLRWGHIRHSKTGILDAFIDLYYLSGEKQISFLEWVQSYYDEKGLNDAFREGRTASFINDFVLSRE